MTPMAVGRRWTQWAGWCLLAMLSVCAAFGPHWVGLDPHTQDLSQSLRPPDAMHWLGTDVYGRSVLARLCHASQLSMGLALLASLTAVAVGASLGVLAAWRPHGAASVLDGVADTVLSVPGLLLVLMVSTLAPGEHAPLYAGLTLVLWVEPYRVCTVVSRPVLAGPGVQASRLLGLGMVHTLRHHVWPALSPLLSTLLALGTAQAVLAMAALGFIGVGLHPPTAELGLLMTEALPHHEEAPWLMAAPVAWLCLLVLAMLLLRPDSSHTAACPPGGTR